LIAALSVDVALKVEHPHNAKTEGKHEDPSRAVVVSTFCFGGERLWPFTGSPEEW
jgi:hypothetical protein